jgi:hypothetical protein
VRRDADVNPGLEQINDKIEKEDATCQQKRKRHRDPSV